MIPFASARRATRPPASRRHRADRSRRVVPRKATDRNTAVRDLTAWLEASGHRVYYERVNIQHGRTLVARARRHLRREQEDMRPQPWTPPASRRLLSVLQARVVDHGIAPGAGQVSLILDALRRRSKGQGGAGLSRRRGSMPFPAHLGTRDGRGRRGLSPQQTHRHHRWSNRARVSGCRPAGGSWMASQMSPQQAAARPPLTTAPKPAPLPVTPAPPPVTPSPGPAAVTNPPSAAPGREPSAPSSQAPTAASTGRPGCSRCSKSGAASNISRCACGDRAADTGITTSGCC